MAKENRNFREEFLVNYLSKLAELKEQNVFTKYYEEAEEYIKTLINRETSYEELMKLRAIISHKKALINSIGKR